MKSSPKIKTNEKFISIMEFPLLNRLEKMSEKENDILKGLSKQL
jgi:hypothetical protein